MIRLLALVLVLSSCANPNFQDMRSNMNGYWEIQSVTLKDGTIKNFNISTTIDYIEILNDSMGLRKKVAPKLDGSFSINKSSERFVIAIEADNLRLHYTTPFSNWKETVVYVDDEILVIVNDEEKVYSYKRFSKFGEQ